MTRPPIDWNNIDTVLLDMDGTLLDLYFDSYLWREHLPRRFAERNGLDVETAKRQIAPRIRAREGTLKWYCLEHWTRELDIDIAGLEREVAHLIAVRPNVPEFLQSLRIAGKHVILATNAHRRSLEHKLERTGIAPHFDVVASSHDYGAPKEEQAFWQALQQTRHYAPPRTLLIDDNPQVLRSAREFGIAHLLAIAHPDSRGPRRSHEDFHALETFLEIMPATPSSV